MPKLTPKQIQDKTIFYLAEYYQKKHQPSLLFSTIRPVFNDTPGKFPIDALLSFESGEAKGHTVLLETKSFCDLQSQLSFTNYKQPLYISAAILSGILGYSYYGYLPWYGSLTLTLLLLIGFWAFLKVLKKMYRGNRTRKIVEEISKLPANEKWIAITKPGLNLLKRKKSLSYINTYNLLITHSIQKNIGILIVTKRKIEVLQNPKFHNGDFLGSYKENNTTRNLSKLRNLEPL